MAVYGNGYEFGETQTGLGGFVYHDATANGSKDNGEAVLPGVTLILTGTLAGGNPITRTAVTDGSGFYGFGDLAAGAYRIHQIQPPNYLDGPDSAGAQGGAPGRLARTTSTWPMPGSPLGATTTSASTIPARWKAMCSST
ncbi:MAG: hypothetical protein IPO29_00160 [Anaerolineae bacterium]|nr:hypothetical protein [Anaerolineae bacterium]